MTLIDTIFDRVIVPHIMKRRLKKSLLAERMNMKKDPTITTFKIAPKDTQEYNRG